MFIDPSVDYIVLLKETDGDARHVIAVGSKSAYKDISTLTPESIEGMCAIASVDAHQPLPDLSKVYSPRQHSSVPESAKGEQFAYRPSREATSQKACVSEVVPNHSQDQIRELNRMLAEERAKTMLKDQTIAELTKRIEQLENKKVEADQPVRSSVQESLLIERETSVHKAEEDMINRLTYLMEKEAELEQYEEDLDYREQRLRAHTDKPEEAVETPALPL